MLLLIKYIPASAHASPHVSEQLHAHITERTVLEMDRNGVPVRELHRYNRSVLLRYAGTHQNAVPVGYFSTIITF